MGPLIILAIELAVAGRELLAMLAMELAMAGRRAACNARR
jgi:hypothetical protein